MKNAILNYENIFYLNGNAISGILSVDGSYNINYSPINTIGVGYNKQVLAEVPNAQFSINKYLLYNDPFLQFTGESLSKQARLFAGSLDYMGKSFGFQSGCLMSFSLDCSVGDIPKTNIDIQAFGNVGKSLSASGNIGTPFTTVPQVRDIILSCSGSSTNRITDFNYSINCPKKPIYILQPSGSTSGPTPVLTPNYSYIPYEILLENPIEIGASFTLEVDSYEAKQLFDQLNNDIDSSFSIEIIGRVFQDQALLVENDNFLTVSGGMDLLVAQKLVGVSIFNQSFNNVKLVSQEFSSNADDILSVRLNYKGYINN